MSKIIRVSSILWRLNYLKQIAENLKDSDYKTTKEMYYKFLISDINEIIELMLPDEIEIAKDKEE